MAPTIRKAERKRAKLRLALSGPSGSGKTRSALELASGLGSKIGLIDTERGSGELYANAFDYDIIQLDAPYTVPKYREAIRAFEEAGYDVLIIDSLSHAWAGTGGLLDKKAMLETSGKYKNDFAAWRDISPEHTRLVDEMLNSPCHTIATMRTKTEWVIEVNEKNRQVPRKIGLAPIMRSGIEYEFTIVMDINDQHVAIASKDRTGLFDGWSDIISKDTGKKLLEWLNAGREQLNGGPHALSLDELIAQGHLAAEASSVQLKSFWTSLTTAQRMLIGYAQLESWKRIANGFPGDGPIDFNGNGHVQP